MAPTDPKSVATQMLASWTSGDFETTRALLTDDMTFLGPLGQTNGADDPRPLMQ